MDFRLPELGEGVYEAELVAWLVKPGESVKRGQSLMEVLTDKASMEVPSPFAGTVTSLQAELGQAVKVGDVMLAYAPAGQREPTADGGTNSKAAEAQVEDRKRDEARRRKAADGKQLPIHEPPSATQAASVRAAPSVRYLARKLGVDLGQIRGSGP